MLNILRGRNAAAVCILISLLLLAACVEKEQTIELKDEQKGPGHDKGLSISQIIQNSASFKEREVTVSGIVSAGKAFQFVNEQPYLIKDDTGEIWVITSGSMPKDGAKATVTGKVTIPFQIKGRKYDIAILETERK